MKLTSNIWPVLAIVAGGLLLKRQKAKGVGHPADWFNEEDLKNYRIYLETGYGKDFTDAELMPHERNQLHYLERAAEEHARRRAAAQKPIRPVEVEIDKALALQRLVEYEHYLNKKYGPGWIPGLIEEGEMKTWASLHNAYYD